MNDGIFVSYSHKDSKVVEKIVSVLKKATGKDIWFDSRLRGGENYFSVIANQIINNKYFVFIVSDNSIASDWCLRELEFAASEKRCIVAIWLDNIDVSPRVKLVIQNTHYINWYSTTVELFSHAVLLAFSNSVNSLQINADQDNDEILPNTQRYFLDKEALKKVHDLLQAESDERYSFCFLPENANLLGIAYETGVSVEPDLKKAALYYRASKYAGDIDGQFLYAALRRKTDPKSQDCLSEMLDAAEKGSVIALTSLGEDYYFGENGMPLDKEKAYDCFEKAAMKNDVNAMYSLAFGYNSGECLEQDFELAYMYALKAKEYGFPKAYRLLAFMYEEGKYLEKNTQKAIELYENAINLGDYLSLCYQGFLLGESGETEKKVELYKKAVQFAEKGKIKSGIPFYRMAILYEDGVGVKQDFEAAVCLYFKAVERNHKNAKKWVVPCILKLDNSEKSKYLHKAYELKCEKAAYELGIIEKNKRDSNDEKLSEKAVKYFESGAELGDIECVEELLNNYSFVIGNGSTVEDKIQAKKWFSFFFANADEEYISMYRELNILSTYYYAYAIELDYDPDFKTPDRDFVLYNFKKSVEECPKHLGNIIYFTVNGYLFSDEFDHGLTIDVKHAEELLFLVQEHLQDYYMYIKKHKPKDFVNEWNESKKVLKEGYMFISKCYKTGKNVPKNKEKSEYFDKLAKQFLLTV